MEWKHPDLIKHMAFCNPHLAGVIDRRARAANGWQTPNKPNPQAARGPTCSRPSSTAHRTLAKPNPVSSWKGRAARLCWRCCSTSVLLCAPGPPVCLSDLPSLLSIALLRQPPSTPTQSAVGCGIWHPINANQAGLIPPSSVTGPWPVDAQSPRFSCKPGPATNRNAPGGSVSSCAL